MSTSRTDEQAFTSVHNIANGIINNALTSSLSDESDWKLQFIHCTPDGSQVLLFFGSHLNVSKFNPKKEGSIDALSHICFLFPLEDDKDIKVKDITISTNGKIVACSDGSIITIFAGEEGAQKILMSVWSVATLIFLPRSSTSSPYLLVVWYGKYLSTLEIDSKGRLNDPFLSYWVLMEKSSIHWFFGSDTTVCMIMGMQCLSLT